MGESCTPIARFAGLIDLMMAILGLTPQALCLRPLRGLSRSNVDQTYRSSNSISFALEIIFDIGAHGGVSIPLPLICAFCASLWLIDGWPAEAC